MGAQTFRNLTGLCLACCVWNLSAGNVGAGVTVDVDDVRIQIFLDTMTPSDVIVDFSEDDVTIEVNGNVWQFPLQPNQYISIEGSDYNDTLLMEGNGSAHVVTFNGKSGNNEGVNDSLATLSFVGGDGRDYMEGGPASDYFYGGLGDDEAHGRGGNDILVGAGGSDMLYGGPGDDILVGDSSFYWNDPSSIEPYNDHKVDLLTGGTGCDTFYYSYFFYSFSMSDGGFVLIKRHFYGTDVVADYDATCDDLIATKTDAPRKLIDFSVNSR